MPVSVIIGGQFGSEGKGKVTQFFTEYLQAKAVIRVGGPNSGHTIVSRDGATHVFKNLPVSAICDNVYSVITSGNYINLEIALKEIETSGIKNDFLYIDPYAVLISQQDLEKENTNGLKESIGSTGSGTGAALSRRINRDKSLMFAKDEPKLSKYIKNTKYFLRQLLNKGERIIIEGTQGFGLSLLHSELYPYSTSRDTSAASFVSEAGLSPLDVDDIIMVLRTFPIRVSGNSGPLPSEVDWATVTKLSGSEKSLIEYTSVTKKIRRIGEFDADIVKKAIEVNNPTRIILNHLDYIDAKCATEGITEKAMEYILNIQNEINRKIDFVGYDRLSLALVKALEKEPNY